MAEMWVLPAGGRPLSGVGACIELLRHVWWLWPLALAMRLPGLNALAQRVYRWIAVHRYCFAGRCVLPQVRVTAAYRHSAFFEMP
jgi:predicted DCC family thiol-disulfide oxidoreductase YuxK